MPQKMVPNQASRISARISGRLAMFSVASQDSRKHKAGLLLPFDQMRQQIERGLAVADEIVIDEIDRAHDAAFEQLVEFGGDLLRRLQPRIAAVEAGDVAEFALIRAARGILDAAEEVARNIRQFIGRNRKLGHVEAIGGLQHDLLVRPRRVARQDVDQLVGGIAEFAAMQIIERRIVFRARRRPTARRSPPADHRHARGGRCRSSGCAGCACR